MLYLAFVLQILIMLGFPVALWLLLKRRPGVTWGLIGAGGLTFIASQVVHLPLNWALGLLGGGRGVALWPMPLMALVAGLSAGICEEVARYLMLRFWRRKARSWAQGVAFGAGHGGVEAIVLGLLVVVNFVAMVALRGMDLGALGFSGGALEQVQAQAAAYWSLPWYLPLLGGLERVLAITIQVSLSLLVLQAFVRHSVGWLLAAIGAHTLVDGVVVFLAGMGWSPLALEGVVLPFALGGLALILTLRPRERLAESAP
jgi:uncharacterized membrane protein YhfC